MRKAPVEVAVVPLGVEAAQAERLVVPPVQARPDPLELRAALLGVPRRAQE